MEYEVTLENFDKIVLNAKNKVILDFWASWCGPCKMLAPIIEEIANERTDITVGKVNVDEQPDLASKFGIFSIPTLIVFENGKEVNKAVGYMDKDQVLDLLN